ncbi:MAG: FRG domain-containing protein [Sarcina sp.]
MSIINNTAEYIKKIVELSDIKEKSFYRGHGSWEYEFEPTIYRESNKHILENEHNIFKDIISTKPEFFNDCHSCLEMLVKMQHHGLPTRLLDLSENPLISLFFACNSESTKNQKIAEITKFTIKDSHFKYYDSDTVSVLCNLAKQDIDFSIEGFTGENINSEKRVKQLLHDIKQEKSYFKEEIEKKHLENYTVVVKAKNSIERIVNQSGVFVLFGMKGKKSICSDLSIINDKEQLDVILIPKDKKKAILKELNLLNINVLTVFGDLDSTAKYFKNKYN